MRWWRRFRAEVPAPFLWSDERVNAFLKTFLNAGNRNLSTRDIKVVVSHRCVEQSSWDLRVEDRYFGWFGSGAGGPFWSLDGPLPAQITLSSSEDPFQERSSSDWDQLSPLGWVSAWHRSESDGVEISLHLDKRRYDAVTGAISRHDAPWSPVLSMALSASGPAVLDPKNLRLPILAYWLTTWPLNVGNIGHHPWAQAHLQEAQL